MFAAEITQSGAYVGVALVACVFWYVVVLDSIGGLGEVFNVVPDVALLMSSCLTNFARLILSLWEPFLSVSVAGVGDFPVLRELDPRALHVVSKQRFLSRNLLKKN